MPIGDFARVVVYTQLDEQSGLNVWFMRFGSLAGPELSNAQRASLTQTAVSVAIGTLIATQATFQTVGWRRIFPGPVTVESLGPAAPIAGAATGGAMPRQSSGIATTLTGMAGRANRGRKYVPFPSEDQNTVDAVPTAQYVLDVDTYMGIFIPTLTLTFAGTTEVWNPVIYRAGNPVTSPNINDWLARKKWATQRRRGSYGVPNIPPA